MKKNILVLTALLGIFVMMSAGVMADQTVIVNGEEVIDFTLTDLNFGAVTPGSLESATSNMNLGVPNNVDFDLSIYLQDGSDPLFDLITMDFSTIGGSATANLGIGSANAVIASVNDADVTDTSTAQTFAIPATLNVPIGILPGQRTAIIVYTITGTHP